MFMVGEGRVGVWISWEEEAKRRKGLTQRARRRGEEERRARFIVPLHAVEVGVAAGGWLAGVRGGGRSWRGGGRGGCGIRVRRGRRCVRHRECLRWRRRGRGAGWLRRRAGRRR